jgi:ABC-type lipoprotein release transport system permease subunit
MPEVASLGCGTYLSLGLRNLWRNPRRTLLTLASLLVGFGALTFLGAMNDGLSRDVKQNFILTLKGHVQIHARGFEASRQIQHYIADPAEVIRVLEGMPDVAAWTLRVRTSGLASVAKASTGVQLLGIDSVREARLTRLAQFVTSGTWLPVGDARALVLGKTLADNLGVGLGDKVILMAQTPSGDLVSELSRLRGILHTGVPEVDRALALVPLVSAQRLLELGHGVTDVVVRAVRHEATDAIRDQLRAALPEADYEVLRWFDLDPLVQQRLELVDTVIYFILLIVVALVIAESLNTMLMTLHERVHEFGLMEALGTRKVQLFAMVLWESVLLVMSGCLAGYLLGVLVVLYFGHTGIDLSRFAKAFTFAYMNPVIYPVLTWYTTAQTLGTTFVAAVLAALYPAWKATRQQPVEAIRSI